MSTKNNRKSQIACLQRKTTVSEQNQLQEFIKTNDKCINNKMNNDLLNKMVNFIL